MASTGGTSGCTILQKLGFRPFNKCNIARFYVPVFGVASYTALSINIINPNMAIRLFARKDGTNFLLASTIIGTGSYIYTRDHMKSAPVHKRLLYSATGAVVVSLGSVLIWAIIRNFLAPNSTVCTILGLGSGITILSVGVNYMGFLDRQISKE